VREINALDQTTIDALLAAGENITSAEFSGDFLYNDLVDQSVQFTAVVLSNPRNSGNSTPNSETMMPSRISIFVRDTTAVHDGNAGMSIQVVDGSYEDNGTLLLAIGDVVTFTGTVDPFFTTMQFAPSSSVEVLGSYEDFGFPDTILDPVTISGTDAVNHAVGADDDVVVNWNNFADYNGEFIRIEDAVIWDRDISGDRPLYYVTTDGGATVIPGYTLSLRFRNDRINTYNSVEFNPLTEAWTPPAAGAVVDIEGFLSFGGGGPDFAGRAATSGALLKISPWEDDDFVVTVAAPEPPAVEDPTRPDALVPADTPFDISVEATPGTDQTMDTVEIIYFTDANDTEMSVTAANTSGDIYTAQIPGQPEGTFVIFKGKATNANNGVTESDWVEFRVLSVIDEIKDITQTFGFGAYGESPFLDMVVPMDIDATVQTSPQESGLITLQDDPDVNPWTGVAARAFGRADFVAALSKGDVINMTEAEIGDFRDALQLDDVVFTQVSTGGDPIADLLLPSTDILSDHDVAQAHEGMILRFENVVITEADAGFGETGFTSLGATEDFQMIMDDSSELYPDGYDPDNFFNDGEVFSFIRGTLFDSFGDHKLLPESLEDDIGEVTNTSTQRGEVPDGFTLDQNYPNPFNPETTIRFAVPTTGKVTLTVFDLTGRAIATLLDAERTAGEHEVRFDGRGLASGMYLYRLTAGAHTTTRRMMLVK
jgi:hypothetical protein